MRIARAAALVLFLVEFLAGARTPEPAFALAIAGGAVLLRRGFRPRPGIRWCELLELAVAVQRFRTSTS